MKLVPIVWSKRCSRLSRGGSVLSRGSFGADAWNLRPGRRYLRHLLGDRSMPLCFNPKTEILPEPQKEIWPLLAPAPRLSFVLYGGTAVALHLGHRRSVDFDFFRSEPLDKKELAASFEFLREAQTIQEDDNTLVVIAEMPSGTVKVSYFGGVAIGRINEPLQTNDAILLVASLEDLLTTKLQTILDRAEARDYQDISAILFAR